MAISFITAASAQAATVNFTTPTAGDCILVFAHRDGSTTAPTVPAGYGTLSSAGANTNSAVVGFKVATGSETSTGTWTNATSIAVAIYRGVNGGLVAGTLTAGTGASTSLSYGALTMKITDSTGWVVGFGAHRTATNVGQAPTGMTLRSSATDIAVSDTNAAVNSWGAQAVTVNANSGWRTATVELLATPPTDVMRASTYIDMDVADATGTVLTTTILANGANDSGIVGSWFLDPSPLTTITVDTKGVDLPVPVVIGATTYPTTTTSRRVRHNHATAFEFASLAFVAGIQQCSVGCFITFGPTNQGAGSQLWDYLRFNGAVSGNFVVLQLNNGSGGGGTGYAVNIETNPGGTTTHSPYFTITPGSRYWCTLKANFQTGVAQMALYNATTLALINSVTGTQTTGEDIAEFQFGQGEEGLQAGQSSYFEHVVLDALYAQFPLGPGTPASATVLPSRLDVVSPAVLQASLR